jgi:hypothetical protein
MDTQQIVWIVGHGPVVVHQQFCVDIRRNARFFLNGHRLSTNVYEAVRRLYETCGILYYQYSKYMNQTMGNAMMCHLQNVFSNCYVVPLQHTYYVKAQYTINRRTIHACMTVRLVEYDTLETRNVVRATTRFCIKSWKWTTYLEYA